MIKVEDHTQCPSCGDLGHEAFKTESDTYCYRCGRQMFLSGGTAMLGVMILISGLRHCDDDRAIARLAYALKDMVMPEITKLAALRTDRKRDKDPEAS